LFGCPYSTSEIGDALALNTKQTTEPNWEIT